ncbi:MAG: glycoside hydrolase family 28 protein [Granulosicoccus sp.]
MTTLSIQSVSAQSVSILVEQTHSYFTLVKPLTWCLCDSSGATVKSGTTTTAAIFFEDLNPDTDYILEADDSILKFKTLACTQLLNITDYGADPDHDDNAMAIQQAIDKVSHGGTVKIPAGRFYSSPLFLKADMTLWLEEGAELKAIADRSEWPILPALDKNDRVLGTWEGVASHCYASLLTCIDCDHLHITGKGQVDGGGSSGDWWSWPKETRNNARRARTVFIAHSCGINLSGLRVKNSPSWTIHLFRCTEANLSAMHIHNPPDSPNTDGLNPESSSQVQISALDFSVGDDCIAIKSGKRTQEDTQDLPATDNISIKHCRMARGHGAVVLGSEMSGGIHDIHIHKCEFEGTDRGLRLKTRRGRGGRISNISMKDVLMRDVATPIAANAFYFCDADGKSDFVQSRKAAAVDATTPYIDGIFISDVVAIDVSIAAVALLGLPESPIKNVDIRNFCVSYNHNAEPDIPLMALNVEPMSGAGIVAEFAEVTGTIDPIAGSIAGSIVC